MESTMDLEKQERLNAMQMSDLGSDRREYISTEDIQRGPRMTYEDIEASRAFRKDKSAPGRQAHAHQPALTAWTALYQDVNDTGNIEKLDHLMHGQTHRARLMETIQERGGQQYGEGHGKNSQSKSENHPFTAVSSSRGGRIVGSRGRGRGLGPSGAPGGVAMRSHSVALPTGHDLTRQDPALDSNNGGPVTAGRNHRGGRSRAPRGQPTRPTPRLRRVAPMADYSTNLASNVEFMKTAQAQGYANPNSQVPSGSASRASTSPARRISPSRSVSPQRRSVTLAGPVARPPLPPPSPKATKKVQPEQPQLPATTLKPFNSASKAPAPTAKPTPRQSLPEQKLLQATSLKPFATAPQLPVPETKTDFKSSSLEQPSSQAKIQKTTPSAPRLSVPETKLTSKDQLPELSTDISLIDFSSEDENPEVDSGSSKKVPTKIPTGPLLDLLVLDDNHGLGLLTPNRSRISQAIENQLSGLEFEPSDPESVQNSEPQSAPQNLQNVTAQATGMIKGLDTCISILQNKIYVALNESKISSSSKQPAEVSTPVKNTSSRDEVTTPLGSKESQTGSFIDHRSPQNSLSSGDSTQRAKETLPEENLSPRKAEPAVSEPPVQGFENLQISGPEPPGLEFQDNEPQTAAARDQPKAQDVRPAPDHGGIGMLSESKWAFDLEHARTIGGARTIGVKPSHTNKINNLVTVEIQRATRTHSRLPSGTSTPLNQPSGLSASIYATDQKSDAASTSQGLMFRPRKASFRSHHRLA